MQRFENSRNQPNGRYWLTLTCLVLMSVGTWLWLHVWATVYAVLPWYGLGAADAAAGGVCATAWQLCVRIIQASLAAPVAFAAVMAFLASGGDWEAGLRWAAWELVILIGEATLVFATLR